MPKRSGRNTNERESSCWPADPADATGGLTSARLPDLAEDRLLDGVVRAAVGLGAHVEAGGSLDIEGVSYPCSGLENERLCYDLSRLRNPVARPILD